jgi:transcriptional regulator GlxA family with amidase domain
MGPALRFVDEHLAERLTVTALARQCRLSEHHYSRVFHARLGRTPTRYIQERRVAVAAERLVSGPDPIERVAADAGFANRYHFTRVFTRCMGVPPATYRRTGRV